MNTTSSKKENNNRICVFFSASYPYETTFKREFEVMSANLDSLHYLPGSIKSGKKQPLPYNIRLNAQLTRELSNKDVHFRQWLSAFLLYGRQMLRKGCFFPYLKHAKTYFLIAFRNIMRSNVLADYIYTNQLTNAI
ncbi:MAG: hypothetical protein ACOC2M_00795, partial [bacterium]